MLVHPQALRKVLERVLTELDRDPAELLALLQAATDPDAGRWAFELAKTEEGWREGARPPLALAKTIAWQQVEPDRNSAARRISEAIPGIEGAEVARRRMKIRQCLDAYEALRTDPEDLSARCFGKQTLERVARSLGFRDASVIEARAAVMWRSGAVQRPAAATAIREYLDSIPVLTSPSP